MTCRSRCCRTTAAALLGSGSPEGERGGEGPTAIEWPGRQCRQRGVDGERGCRRGAWFGGERAGGGGRGACVRARAIFAVRRRCDMGQCSAVFPLYRRQARSQAPELSACIAWTEGSAPRRSRNHRRRQQR